jgi:hypothetical protein
LRHATEITASEKKHRECATIYPRSIPMAYQKVTRFPFDRTSTEYRSTSLKSL